MLFGRKVNLDEVSIAAPCPVDWEAMEGDSRIRFCSLCKLNVYNISEMPRREAEALLNDRAGQLCLRLYRRQDGTIITKDCPVGRGIIDGAKRRMRALAAAFVAMLNSPAVFGQWPNFKASEEDGRVEGPRDSWIFQVNPKIVNGRYYTQGPSELKGKAGRILFPGAQIPESGVASTKQASTQSSEHKDAKGNADTSALDAFRAAQSYEAAQEPDKALVAYENAISSFRNSRVKYDRKFAAFVAGNYAELLRKQHNSQKAATIEKEFCGRK